MGRGINNSANWRERMVISIIYQQPPLLGAVVYLGV